MKNKTIAVLLILMSALSYSCKQKGKELISQLQKAQDYRVAIEDIRSSQLDGTDLLNIKQYFQNINNILFEVKDKKRLKRKMNRYFKKKGFDDFCEISLIDMDIYKELQSQCKVNDFIICPEEVKYYRNYLLIFYKSLTTKNRARLLTSDTCKSKFETIVEGVK